MFKLISAFAVFSLSAVVFFEANVAAQLPTAVVTIKDKAPSGLNDFRNKAIEAAKVQCKALGGKGAVTCGEAAWVGDPSDRVGTVDCTCYGLPLKKAQPIGEPLLSEQIHPY